VLFPVAGAGEASTPGAGDFTTITTLPVATVVSIFGEVDVLVPYGSNQGLYTLKASGPWTPIATLGGELVMVLAGTSFGQPSFWQGINDRGDSAVDPTAEPTSWWQFSVTPAGFRDRRTAALTAYTPGDATDWTDPDPTTVAAALDTLAAGGGAPAAHKTSHEDGGSDELALNASQITAGTLDIARIPDRPPLLLQVSGRYIRTGDRGGAAAPTSNRVFYLPIWIETACTVDRIGVFHEATTAGVGSVARVGIYTSSGGLPASKVMETTIATDTAAAFKVATISESLARGLHFLAVASQPASGSPTFSWGPPDIRCGSTADGTSIGAYFDSSTYSGTLPATAVVNTAVGTQPPLVYLRVA
jgi:hypothetical protein